MSIFFSVIKFCILSFYGHVTFLDSVLIQSCLKLNSSFQNDGFWSNFHYQFEKFNNPIFAFQSEPFKKIQKHHCSNSNKKTDRNRMKKATFWRIFQQIIAGTIWACFRPCTGFNYRNAALFVNQLPIHNWN